MKAETAIWILAIAGTIGACGVIYCLLMLRRNQAVFAYRAELIERIANLQKQDIERGEPFMWRSEVYRSVDYNLMLKRWWVPLDSFYPNKRFLEP